MLALNRIIMIMRVEAKKPAHLFNYINTQMKLATLIIITLNTLTMKHKSEVIKIIVYS